MLIGWAFLGLRLCFLYRFLSEPGRSDHVFLPFGRRTIYLLYEVAHLESFKSLLKTRTFDT